MFPNTYIICEISTCMKFDDGNKYLDDIILSFFLGSCHLETKLIVSKCSSWRNTDFVLFHYNKSCVHLFLTHSRLEISLTSTKWIYDTLRGEM